MAGKRLPNPSKLTAEVELQSHVEWTASLASGTSCEVDKPVHRPGRPFVEKLGTQTVDGCPSSEVGRLNCQGAQL